MTLPYERIGAIVYTEQFLTELLDPAQTPRVPRDIRDRARALLRHYPSQGELGYRDELARYWAPDSQPGLGSG